MKDTVSMLNQQYVMPEGLQPYAGVTAKSPWLADEKEKRSRKICDSLEDAIRRSGLQNGMTISFHHAFRGGDKVVNLVVAKLAEMGFRDLTLASSSLIDAHWPLIEHIKNGVIRQIYTSGLRGKLGEEISAGLMENPVQIHSHGGRAHLVKSGELSIDVAFLGVPCCDEFGNANGFSGKSRCGSLGIGLSVDDFGTGFSGLSRLVSLPVTEIKIDKSFVDRCLTEKRILALLEAITSIGQSLNLTVVAEGVETKEQFEMLRKIHCRVIQGYFFSRPLPAEEIPGWMSSVLPLKI